MLHPYETLCFMYVFATKIHRKFCTAAVVGI